MKVNGYSVPVKDLVIVITASMWLAGLSFQVSSNATEIEEQKDTKERLVSIEVTLENTKDDIKDIKKEQEKQGDKLDKILAKVSER